MWRARCFIRSCLFSCRALVSLSFWLVFSKELPKLRPEFVKGISENCPTIRGNAPRLFSGDTSWVPSQNRWWYCLFYPFGSSLCKPSTVLVKVFAQVPVMPCYPTKLLLRRKEKFLDFTVEWILLVLCSVPFLPLFFSISIRLNTKHCFFLPSFQVSPQFWQRCFWKTKNKTIYR